MKQLCYLLLFVFQGNFAQNAPIELLLKPKSLSLQFGLNRKFSENSKFGYFAFGNIGEPYNNENANYKSHIIQANAYYNFYKDISVFGGLYASHLSTGKSIGFRGVFAFKESRLVVTQRSVFSNDYSSEFIFNYEYRPKLNENITLYSRIQIFAETNFVVYKRGVQQLRFGLTNHQFSYGIGSNFDVFSKAPITYENFGFFVRTEI